MPMKYIDQTDGTAKRVLRRMDFNLPLKSIKVADGTRIVSAVPSSPWSARGDADAALDDYGLREKMPYVRSDGGLFLQVLSVRTLQQCGSWRCQGAVGRVEAKG